VPVPVGPPAQYGTGVSIDDAGVYDRAFLLTPRCVTD
jgi:hypothetical protein